LKRHGHRIAVKIKEKTALGFLRHVLVAGLEYLADRYTGTCKSALGRELPFRSGRKSLDALGGLVFFQSLELGVIKRKNRLVEGFRRTCAQRHDDHSGS
jgi:hypothetical protein